MTIKLNKPFSPACARNEAPILNVLREVVEPRHRSVFEIGSGTGQHAAAFAPQFPHLRWVTADLRDKHDWIRQWTEGIANVEGPVEFELGRNEIPAEKFDLIYSANVLHIVSQKNGEELIRGLGKAGAVAERADVLFYGPFNYQGQYSSPSNEAFDQYLKEMDPESGIRDFEEIVRLMLEQNFRLAKDYEMPANNRILHFAR